jgi:RNA binding exosome subunit
MPQTKERLLHHVIISVFAKSYDDKEKILLGLDQLSPVRMQVLLSKDPQYNPELAHTVLYSLPNITLTVQEAESDDGIMNIYTLFFRKMHDVNLFAKRIISSMTPQELDQYRSNPASLLGADSKLSLRLDKEQLIQGKLVTTRSGNCYQIKASIAAYPKNEETILDVLKRILNGGD